MVKLHAMFEADWLFKDGKWSDESKLLEVDTSKLPNLGVYVIYTGSSIQRIQGSDKLGVIHIGQGNLQSRINAFLKCARGDWQKGHSEGVRFKLFDYAKVTKTQADDLMVRWTRIRNAVELEGKLHMQYIQRFGELPPLNHQVSKSVSKKLRTS